MGTRVFEPHFMELVMFVLCLDFNHQMFGHLAILHLIHAHGFHPLEIL